MNFAKAFEVQVNTVLRQALAPMPPARRMVNVDGRSADAADGAFWSLGQLDAIIARDHDINTALQHALRHGDWFATSLPPILKELASVRNAAAHSERANRQTVARLRNQVVGVGTTGWLEELGKVRVL